MLLVPVKAPAVGKPMSGAIRLAIGSMVEWFDCAADDLARQIQAGVLNSGNNGAQAGSHVLSLSLSLSLSLFMNCAILRVLPSTDLASGYATLTRPTVFLYRQRGIYFTESF